MVRRRGPRLTLAEKTELWRRWRRGESLNAIGRALGRIAKVVRYEVARTGGISPPARQRARRALSLTEREAISRGLARGASLRQISRQLRRAPSTVSREVRRHGGRRRSQADTSSERSRFGSARPPLKTARSQGIGRATCSSAPDSPTWRRWSSGARATCVSSGSPGAKRARSCRRSPSTCGGYPTA